MQIHVEQNQILLRSVQRRDWIKKWYQDDWLNREFGPMHEAWLEYVLSDSAGMELVAVQNGKPVGMIGVLWSTKNIPYHVITDMAVNPSLRRQGLGRRIFGKHNWLAKPPEISKWVTFVTADNEPAVGLQTSMKWIEGGTQNNMRKFTIDV